MKIKCILYGFTVKYFPCHYMEGNRRVYIFHSWPVSPFLQWVKITHVGPEERKEIGTMTRNFKPCTCGKSWATLNEIEATELAQISRASHGVLLINSVSTPTEDGMIKFSTLRMVMNTGKREKEREEKPDMKAFIWAFCPLSAPLKRNSHEPIKIISGPCVTSREF